MANLSKERIEKLIQEKSKLQAEKAKLEATFQVQKERRAELLKKMSEEFGVSSPQELKAQIDAMEKELEAKLKEYEEKLS